MKLLFDLFPVILFFVTFKFAGIYAATGAAIAATVAQIVWTKWRHGKVETMLWVSFGIITVMGGATLLLHDESFIKWKPTLLYWVMGGALLLGPVLAGRNLLKLLLGDKLELPEPVWSRLNLAWVTFFASMGALNLWVAFSFPTSVWVNFKLFGGLGLMVLFTLGQGIYLSRHLKEPQ